MSTPIINLKFAVFAAIIAALPLSDCIVVAQNPSSRSMASRSLDGVLQPFYCIDVATTEIGILKKVLVQPGDYVIKGQPLAELDCEAIEAQIRVKEIEANSRGKIEQVRAELALQQARFDKLQSLHDENKISTTELERSEMDLTITRGRQAAEEDSLRILQADLERIRQQLSERTIRSPIAGIITEIPKQIGEFVASNSPSVAKVVDISKLRATFSVEESELKELRRGGAVRILLSSGNSIEGIVEYIPPVADAETGWFMINVLIDNQDRNIIGSRCQLVP